MAIFQTNTRAAILAATEALMRERGLDRLTLSAVAKRSGPTVNGVKHHFPNVDILAQEQKAAAVARYRPMFELNAIENQEEFARTIAATRTLRDGAVSKLPSLRPYWGIAPASMLAELASIIGARIKPGGSHDPEVVGRFVLAFIDPSSSLVPEGLGRDLAPTAEQLADIVFNGLLRVPVVATDDWRPHAVEADVPGDLERILDVASQTAVAPGTRGLNMADIQRRAGVSNVGLYALVQNRPELIARIVDRSGERVLQALAEPQTGFAAAPQRLLRLLAPLVMDRAAGCLVLDPSLTDDPTREARARTAFSRLRAALTAIVHEGQSKGYFRQLPVGTAAQLCLDVLDGAYGLRPAQVKPYLSLLLRGVRNGP